MPVVLPTDVEFQIPHDGKYVAFVRKGVILLARGAGFSEQECQEVEIAVGEAVTNAVCHGRPTCREGKVYVRCRLTPHRLVIEVEDEGDSPGLDLPVALPDDNDEHGRGWILIYNLMDRTTVRCTGKGVLVRLVKRRRRLRQFSHHQRLHANVA